MSGICEALIKKGKNKGESCGRKTVNESTCGLHTSRKISPTIERKNIDYLSLKLDLNPHLIDLNSTSKEILADISTKHHESLREILNILMYDECKIKAEIIVNLMEGNLVFCDIAPVERYYLWCNRETLWKKKDISLLCEDVYNLFEILLVVMTSSMDESLAEEASTFKRSMRLSGMKEISAWVVSLMIHDMTFKSKIDSKGMFCFDDKIIDITSYNVDIGLTSVIRNRRKEDLRTYALDIKLPRRDKVDFEKIDQFMNDITLDDRDKQKFMLMMLGTSLLGENKWQKIYICIGETSNGKSTLFNLMQQILEDKYHQASREVFLDTKESDAGSAKSHLSALEDKLMVVLSETRANISLNEEQIKGFTGSDMINGRKLNKEESPFRGKFTPFILSNFMPDISIDKAMRRRIVVVEFPCTFVSKPSKSDERKLDVNYRFNENDRHAMFYLLMDGIIASIGITEIKIESTIKTESDIQIDEFLSDCFEESKDSRESSPFMYEKYKEWCINSSSKEIFNRYSLGRKLTSRLDKIKSTGGIIHYKGIKHKH